MPFAVSGGCIVPVPDVDAITKLVGVFLSGCGAVRLLAPWHKKRMARANKLGARAVLILGEAKLERGAVAVRDLDTGEQEEIPLAALEDRLARFQ